MSRTDEIRATDVLRGVPRLLGRTPGLLRAGRLLNPLRKHISLGGVIADAARRYPNNPAILYEDQAITYRQLHERSNRVANFLAAQGIVRGDVVVLLMENRPEFLICAIAIGKLGAVASLINTSQTGKVLTHSINLVSPRQAIVGTELTEAFDAVCAELDLPADQIYAVADRDTARDPGETPNGYRNLMVEAADASAGTPAQMAEVTKEDPLFYIYTSGTTGMPKASITNHLRWVAAHCGFGYLVSGMRPTDRFYLTLPLYHATGLLVCWGAIVSGPAAIVIGRRFSASRFWEDVERYQCTGFGYVGELCRYLLNRPALPNDADNPVRMMIGNGLRPSIWKEFRRRFGIDNIYEFYASSEGNVAFLNIFNLDNTMGFGGGNAVIVQYDKETEQPLRGADGFMKKVKKGEPGLLIGRITPATPFVGYTQKEKTEAAILKDVFKKGDRYFNTGDLVREVGFKHFQFVDRTGDTFRWKSENVSTTEVESILALHPQIAEAVVYGVEVPGNDGRAGMAAITPNVPADELDLADLQRYLARELPPYAVPLFLRLREQMETTGTFKYKKTDLKSEGFDPGKVDDPMFVLLDRERGYEPLTGEVHEGIQAGAYRF